MTLNETDAKLFYELLFPLLDYVNKKFGVNPRMGKIHGARHSDPMAVKEIANALWDNAEVIDEYLKKQGALISEENREIVRSWKRRIGDDFILERNLKSGSVFISCTTDEVYLVKGIISPWEEVLYDMAPPIMLNAVLIPFRDVIISDGLVLPYGVSFGPNSREGFREAYMTAKKSGAVRKSL